MSTRDAATAALDATVDGIGTEVSTAAELFAVVDLLDGQPMLRRSLSDPSATEEGRAALAARLFEGKVSASALAVISAVVGAAWSSGTQLVLGLERQAVRLSLQAARRSGELETVSSELYQLAETVDGSAELAAALRNQALPATARRELIDGLVAGRVHAVTAALAARAVNDRVRSYGAAIGGYLETAAGLSGQRIARVTVARPLDEARIARLKTALTAQVGGPVNLQISVDPAVLGGISVAIDDDVYESTVAARLEDARRQLINL